jgi:thiol:disulfide interchange protein
VRSPLLLLILVWPLAGCSGIPWEGDYTAGMQRAAQLRRRALIQFCNAITPECREMELDVLSDPGIQQLVEHYVPIRVDSAIRGDLVRQYGINTVPSYVVVRPDMSVAGIQSGKIDLDTFRIFLIRHVYD